MSQQRIFLYLFATLCLVHTVHAFVEGLYCGTANCYEVLGVTREVTKRELSRSYRKLARKFHPDMSKEPDADVKFRAIATAYEILKDDDSRTDYDYMLDNPEEAYYHYYRFYRRRLTPKVDVRYVLAVTITVISVLQYLHKAHRYEEAISFSMQYPKYRNQALQIIHQEGLLEHTKTKNKNKKSKEERKKEEERVLREVVEDSIEIRGGYSKPTYMDVLWVQLACSPYTAFLYIKWYGKWIYKIKVTGEEYGPEEKEYLTYSSLNMTEQYWSALEDYDREDLLRKELWVPEKLKVYREQREDEIRMKNAESGRHKMWRRYMKKGGPGAMTFMED